MYNKLYTTYGVNYAVSHPYFPPSFSGAELLTEKVYRIGKMKSALLLKIKESLFSVLPVVAIVLILCCTPLVNLTGTEIGVFCVSAVLLILGLGLFNLGADIAMSPMGDAIGAGLTKSKKIPWLLLISFAMGILITVAEPDLSVLAEQVGSAIDPVVLIVAVGVGVGIFLLLAVLKIAFKVSLSKLLMFFYLALFSLVAILIETGKADFLPVSFDSGGVTTGPITVPFIMAFGVGIAQTLGGKDSNENSFGLIAMCSVGPILAVTILGITSKGSVNIGSPEYGIADDVVMGFLRETWKVTKEIALSLGLITLFFFALQFIFLKLPKRQLLRITVGLVYTFVGMILFLTSASIGFMPIGFKLGSELASASPAAVIVLAFVVGAVVVLAEPAVHVLNKQVEEVTDKAVSKRSMLIALSIGVGISIGLSMLRVWLDFSLLYYIIPGYILSLGLSFFVPKLYTAIAFDSGGVASGPLTSSFILPFAIGACCVMQGESKILSDAFGVVAMVAMTPLITIQLLGFRAIMAQKVRDKIAMNRILRADDEQIIDFM